MEIVGTFSFITHISISCSVQKLCRSMFIKSKDSWTNILVPPCFNFCLQNSTPLVGPSRAAPTVRIAKHQVNVAQHSGAKNVTRSRMLQKSHEPMEPNSNTENFPKEAFLCKPQVCLYDLFVVLLRLSVCLYCRTVNYTSPIILDFLQSPFFGFSFHIFHFAYT